MPRISRRTLLRGLLAGSALSVVPVLPRFGRRAHAQVSGQAYPTIFIHLRGGLDNAMHWDAKTGLANRAVQAADIRETAAGIRWYQPVLSPLTAHMEDMTLIRNLRANTGHPDAGGALWWGVEGPAAARTATPWANYLASELLTRKKVPAPALATFFTIDGQPIRDLTGLSNNSPDPAAAAQRVQGLTDFSNALDVVGGMPPVGTQERVYEHVLGMDGRHYSPSVQPRTIGDFLAGNLQASELLEQPPPNVWPPADATVDLFSMSAADITRRVSQNNQRFVAHVAMAYEAARLQVSHVMFIQHGSQGDYDTHEGHNARQRTASSRTMPVIARLLSALKATVSPIDPDLSMFDTTHVVIMSELSRSPNAQLTGMGGTPRDGTGTAHNGWTQAALFGGNFKGGVAFGATNNNLRGIRADFSTGALNQGSTPSLKNLHATILKANGVNPTGWDAAAPIDAVLKGA